MSARPTKASKSIPTQRKNGENKTETKSNNAILPYVIIVINKGDEAESVTAKPFTGNGERFNMNYKRLAVEDRDAIIRILNTTIQSLKHDTDERNETHDIRNLFAKSRYGADTGSRSRSQKQVLRLILQIGQSSLHLSLEYTSGRLTDASVTGKPYAGDKGCLIMKYKRSANEGRDYLTNILEITILIAKHNADMACQQELEEREQLLPDKNNSTEIAS